MSRGNKYPRILVSIDTCTLCLSRRLPLSLCIIRVFCFDKDSSARLKKKKKNTNSRSKKQKTVTEVFPTQYSTQCKAEVRHRKPIETPTPFCIDLCKSFTWPSWNSGRIFAISKELSRRKNVTAVRLIRPILRCCYALIIGKIVFVRRSIFTAWHSPKAKCGLRLNAVLSEWL